MAAIAAMLTSCSKDDAFGGLSHGKVTFEVSTPELTTRAYGDGKTATKLYYAVYDVIENDKVVKTGSETLVDLKATVSIDLVEGRKYEVAFWAESPNSPYTFDRSAKTVSYATTTLAANNEAYDAFFAYVPESKVVVGSSIKVELKRPFAQLNVATNDTTKAAGLGVEVKKTGLKVKAYTSLNLETGAVSGQQELTFAMTNKMDDGDNTDAYDWLTMNYILVNERENIDITFLFEDNKGKTDYTRPYAAVPVQRNYRTNVIGSILTDPTDFNVEIKPGVDGEINEERNKRREVATASEIEEALATLTDGDPNNDINEVVLTDNVNFDEVLLIGGASSVNANASFSPTPITRTEATEKLTITINGNGKTISSSASRVIRIAKSNVNVIIKDLNVVSTAERVGTNDVRGIAVDPELNNVDLTLVNCSVVFEHLSANDWAYAVNVAGNGTGHNVTINGGEYEGANVVNVYGANNTVTVNNATLTSMYPANETYFGACIWVLQNQGSKVFAKGNTFNGTNAIAFNLGTGTELTESDNIDNCAGVYNKDGVYHIYNAAGLKKTLEAAGAAGAGNTKLEIESNIDMTYIDWTPIKVKGYEGAGVVTIEGNNKTLTGMKAALFDGGFAGKSGIVIKNLTIANSDMSATNTQGYGAFVNCADSMTEITLENCHLINSTIITPNNGAAESRIGGLVGWTAGYNNPNDGPVDSYITIKNCSVEGCTIKGAGSIGAIVGHAGANAATYTKIEDCVVRNNTLTSTDDGGWRVGVVVGTANNGQCEIYRITESGNVISQTDKTAPEGQSNYYGRFVPAGTGLLIIDGVANVGSADGLATAVAKGCTNITLSDGEYDVDNCGGKTLTLNGTEKAVLKLKNEGEDGCDYAFGSSSGVGNVTFNGLTIDTTENTGNYKGFAYMKGTFNNCNFVGAYSLNNSNDFVFSNCTFDFQNGYFWTWGANSVKFDGCTFNGNSKNILAHGYASTVITINNCNFAATEKGYTGAGDNTACVEIAPAGNNTYTINFTGSNTKTEHYAGWTRVKDGSTGHTITGVE